MRIPTVRIVSALALGMLIGFSYGLVSYKFDLFPVTVIRLVKEASFDDDTNRVGFRATEGRLMLECPAAGTDVAVLLIAGQSNSANHGETRHRPRQGVVNFNWFDGRCYRAEDPLLGATGYGGSIFGRLADRLIESGAYRSVVLVPVGVNASLIERWAPGGDLNPRLHTAIAGLRSRGLDPTHVLWQQGEADAMQGTDYASYSARLGDLIDDMRARHVDAPVFVAVASMCHNPGSQAVRAAQRDAANLATGVFPGPNSDLLDSLVYRYDGCHFSDAALDELAGWWFEALLGPTKGLAGEAGQGISPR
ncbi:MAG: hypothetical protein KDH19_20005 [Geminicoccaceae bacterium]|nr:hypothetical protein [Gammaproteobacteria bacterium]MCB1835706.1 hypothetical protein [Geminicoccaceae bacterium]